MVMSPNHPHCSTVAQVRELLRNTRDYRGVQKRVARRLRVSSAAVSRAASGRWPGRYRRIELALLQEMTRFSSDAFVLLEKIRAEEARAGKDGNGNG